MMYGIQKIKYCINLYKIYKDNDKTIIHDLYKYYYEEANLFGYHTLLFDLIPSFWAAVASPIALCPQSSRPIAA